MTEYNSSMMSATLCTGILALILFLAIPVIMWYRHDAIARKKKYRSKLEGILERYVTLEEKYTGLYKAYIGSRAKGGPEYLALLGFLLNTSRYNPFSESVRDAAQKSLEALQQEDNSGVDANLSLLSTQLRESRMLVESTLKKLNK